MILVQSVNVGLNQADLVPDAVLTYSFPDNSLSRHYREWIPEPSPWWLEKQGLQEDAEVVVVELKHRVAKVDRAEK